MEQHGREMGGDWSLTPSLLGRSQSWSNCQGSVNGPVRVLYFPRKLATLNVAICEEENLDKYTPTFPAEEACLCTGGLFKKQCAW